VCVEPFMSLPIVVVVLLEMKATAIDFDESPLHSWKQAWTDISFGYGTKFSIL
jgi:hypothetical protein